MRAGGHWVVRGRGRGLGAACCPVGHMAWGAHPSTWPTPPPKQEQTNAKDPKPEQSISKLATRPATPPPPPFTRCPLFSLLQPAIELPCWSVATTSHSTPGSSSLVETSWWLMTRWGMWKGEIALLCLFSPTPVVAVSLW